MIATYNGKSFDIPFIKHYFNIRLGHAHIDLRCVLYNLGYRGGLKGCERQLSMDRGDLNDIDGFFAVLLWDEYQRTGDQKALDTLLAYNIQDTVTLENLVVTAYNMKLKDTPPFYETCLIRESTPPVNPFSADLVTIGTFKSSSQYWSLGRCIEHSRLSLSTETNFSGMNFSVLDLDMWWHRLKVMIPTLRQQ